MNFQVDGWQGNMPVNRSHSQIDISLVGTDDRRESLRSSDDSTCNQNVPASSEIDMKFAENNGCIEARSVQQGSDQNRFDSYQSVGFVNYINQNSQVSAHGMERKFQNLENFVQRSSRGEDSDQQLSVISEYIEEEEGFVDDEENDDIDKCHDVRGKDRCRDKSGAERLDSARENRHDYSEDIDIDCSSDNSSKTDSEGSKLLIIS